MPLPVAPWLTASAPTCARDLDLALGDQRPRDRGAEQVQPLVERVGAHHREDVIADEFLAQVVDEDVLGPDPHQLGLVPRRLQLLALAEVGGEGHHLAAIGLLQPFQDHAGVEAARKGEHDALDLVGHVVRVLRATWLERQWRAPLPPQPAPFKRHTGFAGIASFIFRLRRGMPMKKFLIAAAALMAGTAALAQTAPAPHAPPRRRAPMAHPMADKVMTRAEVVAMVREHFGADGRQQGRRRSPRPKSATRHGKWAEHRKDMGGPHGMACRDAAIPMPPSTGWTPTRTARSAATSSPRPTKQRIERRVEIREAAQGRRQGRQGGPPVNAHASGMGGFGGRMIVMADTNKDGRITLAEAEALALQHFDQMDTNRDGQVTPEERRAGRPMMIKKVIEEKKTAGLGRAGRRKEGPGLAPGPFSCRLLKIAGNFGVGCPSCRVSLPDRCCDIGITGIALGRPLRCRLLVVRASPPRFGTDRERRGIHCRAYRRLRSPFAMELPRARAAERLVVEPVPGRQPGGLFA